MAADVVDTDAHWESESLVDLLAGEGLSSLFSDQSISELADVINSGSRNALFDDFCHDD